MIYAVLEFESPNAGSMDFRLPFPLMIIGAY